MTAEATLSSGQYNYLSLLTPGDHALIWMHNDISQFNRIYKAASTNTVANDSQSGLKFIGKVNSVRAVYITDATGVKSLRYNVTFKGFSEFGTTVYYNPFLHPIQYKDGNPNNYGLEVYAAISSSWQSFFFKNKNGIRNVQSILDFFITTFLGTGPQDNTGVGQSGQTLKYGATPNGAFLIPKELASILGLPTGQNPSYSDILHTIMGVQEYETAANGSSIPTSTNYNNSPVNKVCTHHLYGNKLALPDLYNSHPLWSLLDQNCNNVLNEIYTTLRQNENGLIVPHFIARQKPFTTKFIPRAFQRTKQPPNYSNIQWTRFENVPRWSIDPSIAIGSFNLGTSDATRFNFFQTFSLLTGTVYGETASQELIMQEQILKNNFTVDTEDISRNGTRLRISQADVAFNGGGLTDNIPAWCSLVSDWFANGHLRLTGTLQVAGVMQPICVGDNLEVANKLFHIESVQHAYSVSEGGFKTFISSFELSQGMLTNGEYAFQEATDRQSLDTGFEPGYNYEDGTSEAPAQGIGGGASPNAIKATIGLE
jgi:hypothetical protein